MYGLKLARNFFLEFNYKAASSQFRKKTYNFDMRKLMPSHTVKVQGFLVFTFKTHVRSSIRWFMSFFSMASQRRWTCFVCNSKSYLKLCILCVAFAFTYSVIFASLFFVYFCFLDVHCTNVLLFDLCVFNMAYTINFVITNAFL